MTFVKQRETIFRRRPSPTQLAQALLAAVLTLTLSACGGSANIPVSSASGPQVYMSPAMGGAPMIAHSSVVTPATYSIDDTTKTFADTTYAFSDTQSGGQVQYSGKLCPDTSNSNCPSAPVFQRGLLEAELTYACGQPTGNGCTGVFSNLPPVWAVELTGQAGGLAEIQGLPLAPLVPAVSCPAMTTPQTFLFVTLPNHLNLGPLAGQSWNPQIETAYGSVDLSASGSTVTLNNIAQYTLPSGGVSGTPVNPSASTVTGVCSQTPYGNTVSVPGQVTITNPGSSNQNVTPQALLGIGPSGLLVEDNGTTNIGTAINPPFYQNALGAGTGAIGLPKSSSVVDTGALVGAQYLGFFYGGGQSNTTWSTSPASFGFPSLPANCATVTPQTSTILYGGDFTNSNPTTSTTGYGNCDFAVDLGTQDAATNGLYPSATVYVGSGFGTNTTGKTYSFPAVGIAGQVNGKYAIFLIGMDSVGSPNQAWGIYLLQSN